MATKTQLPPIDEELTPPRPRLNLRNLRPRDALPDETVEANSRTMGESWGASTQLLQPEEQTPLTSVRLDLPEYVDRQLKLKVATEGGTKAFYILKALASDGFHIRDIDLRLDRRRRGKQK
ncbi:MAG: hypothetical protein WB524_00290 [Acidobacteriaceae bacterium]